MKMGRILAKLEYKTKKMTSAERPTVNRAMEELSGERNAQKVEEERSPSFPK